MRIGIASDHRGVFLKEKIKNYLDNYNIIDYGTNSNESVDYPIFAFKLGEDIRDKKIDLGILICGTGIGMSIACNKVKNVRCARVCSINDTILAREHNNANVISFGEDVMDYKKIVDTFINTKFSNEEKHKRRIEMIDKYDN